MKAVVYESYGSPEVLKLKEIERPEVPDDGVLVRVRASSVNITDWYAMVGLLPARPASGLMKPKNTRLGEDFAGIVEAVGKDVSDFRPGDEVFGGRNGAFAEYITVRKMIVHKPADITFEEAAAVPTAAITALQGLRDFGNIQPGQKVLINGASGGVGLFSVQIAKAFGAEVTAVCSTRNVERVRSFGADDIYDYTKEDFTRSGHRYDLLLEVNGRQSWFEYKRVLTPDAAVVIIGGPKTPLLGPLGHVIKMKLASLHSKQKLAFFLAKFTREDMQVLKELLETGKIKPYVEKTYPLIQFADAMRHLGSGHAEGKIVLTMG